MTKQMTREQWLIGLRAQCEQVGNCIEWQGRMMAGKTPLAYVPRGYLLPDLTQCSHSARMVLWTLAKGERPPMGSVLRARCGNDACVDVEHMQLFTRAEAPAEQSRRGELSTPKRKAASITRARARGTKLSVQIASDIRACDTPARELAPVHGVSPSTINAVRRGELWPELASGASVFNWRPAA